ncbi:amidase [Aneurinibacillus sp. Ricciae_BoGa-3]|uniref:amidase n=1 Tax=Aneurinibacillus sp. Ricciae_BoGa-3 TaxID=3022697 RepID=UPI00234141B2|nr:amidase [Aneurinibacillus sp. Ricciae_BoGa-3]WCK52352.1 amidase [Aneurinibacillus sp. Ricciae_BoGa-3]
MISPNEVAYMSASQLASKIKTRELSPVEVTEAFITRIEERNKSLNSFVYFGYDDAMEKAKEAERAILAGEDVGLLHGVPTALKDLFGAKRGWVSTFGGIRALKDNVVNYDNPYCERLEKEGAIFVGKTNSPILGFRAVTDNYFFGPTRNPFDLSRNPGGSSGGGAAAVADGLLPIAEGSDSGGSTRIPAAWCGIFGFKPAGGRVPYFSRPDGFRTHIFSTEGTLTRTVEDAALGLSALVGYDDRDPYSVNEKLDFLSALRGSIKGWRIAYSPNFGVYPVDKRVADVVAKAVNIFKQAGAIVEEVDLVIPYPQRELSDLFCRIAMRGCISFFEGYKTKGIDLLKDYRQDLTPQCLQWMDKVYQMNLLDINRDQIMRTTIYDSIQNVFKNYDLLITPTVACLPAENAADGNTMGPTHINGEEVDPLIGYCLTYLTNFTGHPCASIPAGLVDQRLPVGMQIIGKRYGDVDVLTASAVFEQLKPWYHTYDICKNRPLDIVE